MDYGIKCFDSNASNAFGSDLLINGFCSSNGLHPAHVPQVAVASAWKFSPPCAFLVDFHVFILARRVSQESPSLVDFRSPYRSLRRSLLIPIPRYSHTTAAYPSQFSAGIPCLRLSLPRGFIGSTSIALDSTAPGSRFDHDSCPSSVPASCSEPLTTSLPSLTGHFPPPCQQCVVPLPRPPLLRWCPLYCVNIVQQESPLDSSSSIPVSFCSLQIRVPILDISSASSSAPGFISASHLVSVVLLLSRLSTFRAPPSVVSLLRIPTSVRFSVIFDTRLRLSSSLVLPLYPYSVSSFRRLVFGVRFSFFSYPRLPVLSSVFRLPVFSVFPSVVCRIVIRVFLVSRLSTSTPSSLGISVLVRGSSTGSPSILPFYFLVILWLFFLFAHRSSTTPPLVSLFVPTRPRLHLRVLFHHSPSSSSSSHLVLLCRHPFVHDKVSASEPPHRALFLALLGVARYPMLLVDMTCMLAFSSLCLEGVLRTRCSRASFQSPPSRLNQVWCPISILSCLQPFESPAFFVLVNRLPSFISVFCLYRLVIVFLPTEYPRCSTPTPSFVVTSDGRFRFRFSPASVSTISSVFSDLSSGVTRVLLTSPFILSRHLFLLSISGVLAAQPASSFPVSGYSTGNFFCSFPPQSIFILCLSTSRASVPSRCRLCYSLTRSCIDVPFSCGLFPSYDALFPPSSASPRISAFASASVPSSFVLYFMFYSVTFRAGFLWLLCWIMVAL